MKKFAECLNDKILSKYKEQTTTIILKEKENFLKEMNTVMPHKMQDLLKKYIWEIKKIYGSHLQKVILYGSYARGDFKTNSDVDIMILLNISDMDIKAYSQKLSYMTYDFNMDNNLDIKPIVKNENHFRKWILNYPFYANIQKEGVVLYGAA